MLHSEDPDINDVVKQVIELDKKAARIKKNVVERADTILEKTKEEIKAKEKIEIDGAQKVAKVNYQNEIQKAKDERLSIISQMEKEVDKVRCRYDEKKVEKATEVLDKLFETRIDGI